MLISEFQQFNQALIKMAVLFYQVDGKITLTEQDYLDNLLEMLDWQSPISIEAYHNEVVHQVRQIIDAGEGRQFLHSIQQELNFDADLALEVAMNMTGADGDRCDEETELLSLLTHKVLAKSLTVNMQQEETQLAS